MPLIVLTAELVTAKGQHVLDLPGCAELTRHLNRRPDRVLLTPLAGRPPFTHTMFFFSGVLFLVEIGAVTEREAVPAGLVPLPPDSPTPPGESVQEAIHRGLPGWRWSPEGKR